MPDFRLETFLSVCDTMNYRRSAELLHITQPAVTKHIQHLEETYGCRLFRYENRRLKKTGEAQLLERYARTVRMQEQNLLRELCGAALHDLRVGATKTIGECVIGRYAERFISDQSRELSLIVDNTETLLQLIDRGRLDFALIEGSFDRTRYGCRLYSREPFVGVCAAGHPFAGREVSLSELLDETLLCREEGSGTRAILENTLQEFSESISHFRRRICISSFPIIMDFVKKGLGVSFVYEVLARQEGTAVFTLQGRSILREFNFVYLPDTGAEHKIDLFTGKGAEP